MDQNKAANSNSSKVLNIEGYQEHVEFALSEISDLLSSAPIVANDTAASGGGIITEVLSCPQPLLGLLIGRNGWTLKRIIRVSGANITINQSVLPTQPRRVIIYGTAENVALAKALVERVLSAQSQSDAAEMMNRAGSQYAPAQGQGQGHAPPQFQSKLSVNQGQYADATGSHGGFSAPQYPKGFPPPGGTPRSIVGSLSIFGEQEPDYSQLGGSVRGQYSPYAKSTTPSTTPTYGGHAQLSQHGFAKSYGGAYDPAGFQRRPVQQQQPRSQAPSTAGTGYVDPQQLAYLHRLQQVQNQQLQELEKQQRQEREFFMNNLQQVDPEPANDSHMYSLGGNANFNRGPFSAGVSDRASSPPDTDLGGSALTGATTPAFRNTFAPNVESFQQFTSGQQYF
jgi:hypothetical protein